MGPGGFGPSDCQRGSFNVRWLEREELYLGDETEQNPERLYLEADPREEFPATFV